MPRKKRKKKAMKRLRFQSKREDNWGKELGPTKINEKSTANSIRQIDIKKKDRGGWVRKTHWVLVYPSEST